MQVTKNKSISLRAVRFLHKVPHVCVAADESGNVHFIDTMKCEKAGMFSAEGFGLSRNSLSSPANGDGISAVEIDDTDSFLVAGDCNGFIQVWDISQVCADGVLDTSLRIELFRWKAHREEVSQITYIPKHNLMMTASREIRYPAMLWTVTGVQIGILGHARWTSDVLVEKTACLSAAGGDRSSLSEPVKSSPRLGGGFIARLQEAGPSRLQKLGLLQGAAGVLVQEGANQRQRNLTEMAAQLEKEAQRLAEEDKVPRGQLTVTVQSVLQMPHSDEGSRVDPYCCVKLEGHPERRTRTIENMSDAAFNEHFLYFVEGLSVELTVEVWDYDPGGDQLHDFIGQISGRVDDLFMGGHRIDLSMQLTNKDGSNPGTLGHIELRLEFDAVTSELDVRDRPRNLQDTIKQVLSKHRQDAFIATTPHHVIDHGTVSEKHDESFFVPLPLKHTGVGYAEISNVTSLATARWDTSDFRNLAVYRFVNTSLCQSLSQA